LGDLGVDERIILIWLFRKQGVKMWIGLIWLRIGPVVIFCEHGNNTSSSIKGGEFLN
jgi:hypothetical protein